MHKIFQHLHNIIELYKLLIFKCVLYKYNMLINKTYIFKYSYKIGNKLPLIDLKVNKKNKNLSKQKYF